MKRATVSQYIASMLVTRCIRVMTLEPSAEK
jgi:hypothetical protein